MSQDYQTRQLITKEGNLSRPICVSHNSHTYTDNTRQSKPQLRDFSCSSAIPSHNSRDVILSHNSRNVTCLPSILSHNSRDIVPSHNSRNIPASRPLRYHPKPCRPRTSKAFKFFSLHYRLALPQNRLAKFRSRPLGGTPMSLGASCL